MKNKSNISQLNNFSLKQKSTLLLFPNFNTKNNKLSKLSFMSQYSTSFQCKYYT